MIDDDLKYEIEQFILRRIDFENKLKGIREPFAEPCDAEDAASIREIFSDEGIYIEFSVDVIAVYQNREQIAIGKRIWDPKPVGRVYKEVKPKLVWMN